MHHLRLVFRARVEERQRAQGQRGIWRRTFVKSSERFSVVSLNYRHIKSTTCEPGRPGFGAAYSPPCITARGGRAINNNVAKPPLTRGRGGVPIEKKRKTTRATAACEAARRFHGSAATSEGDPRSV